MITNPAATTVLCYGDSNTHGIPSDDPDYVRLAADVRWTGRLQVLLGEGYSVIEEGLSGRTVDLVYDDRPGLSGVEYLLPCLLTHAPLDIVVLMLGTNDTKIAFDRSADEIAASWSGLLDLLPLVLEAPRVFLVSPAPLDDRRPGFPESDAFDLASVAKSRDLAAAYRRIATERGPHFLDAARAAEVGHDGVHFTLESHDRFARMLHEAIIAS